MTQKLEEKIAHLEIVQGVIGRLANNSSSMKSLSGTVVAAAIALYGTINDASWPILLGAALPVIVFWFLDARYFKLECAYRHLYDAIRKDQVTDPFSMDYKPYDKRTFSLLKSLISWSVAVVYVVLLVAIGIIALSKEWEPSMTKAIGV